MRTKKNIRKKDVKNYQVLTGKSMREFEKELKVFPNEECIIHDWVIDSDRTLFVFVLNAINQICFMIVN